MLHFVPLLLSITGLGVFSSPASLWLFLPLLLLVAASLIRHSQNPEGGAGAVLNLIKTLASAGITSLVFTSAFYLPCVAVLEAILNAYGYGVLPGDISTWGYISSAHWPLIGAAGGPLLLLILVSQSASSGLGILRVFGEPVVALAAGILGLVGGVTYALHSLPNKYLWLFGGLLIYSLAVLLRERLAPSAENFLGEPRRNGFAKMAFSGGGFVSASGRFSDPAELILYSNALYRYIAVALLFLPLAFIRIAPATQIFNPEQFASTAREVALKIDLPKTSLNCPQIVSERLRQHLASHKAIPYKGVYKKTVEKYLTKWEEKLTVSEWLDEQTGPLCREIFAKQKGAQK